MMNHLKNKNDIIENLKIHSSEIFTFGVRRVGIFGSFVRNCQNEASDLDLLVEFEKDKKTFDNFISLSFFLEELFKLPVELITPESLSPYIGPHILKEVEYVDLAH